MAASKGKAIGIFFGGLAMLKTVVLLVILTCMVGTCFWCTTYSKVAKVQDASGTLQMHLAKQGILYATMRGFSYRDVKEGDTTQLEPVTNGGSLRIVSPGEYEVWLLDRSSAMANPTKVGPWPIIVPKAVVKAREVPAGTLHTFSGLNVKHDYSLYVKPLKVGWHQQTGRIFYYVEYNADK